MLEEVKSRPIQRLDYIGFEFNGIHSSQIGVYRTSDGNRYNDSFLPTIQDLTSEISGADGTYFFDSYYTQKPIDISVSFDNLSERNLRELKVWLSEKKPRKLIFDEIPYKYYMVKITGSPSLSFLSFDEVCDSTDDGAFLVSETNTLLSSKVLFNDEESEEELETPPETYTYYKRRVYKGEGKFSFVAYEPFAKNVFSYLDDFDDDVYPNKTEWASSSGLLNNNKQEDEIYWNTALTNNEDPTNFIFNVYNGGDYETDFKLKIFSNQSAGLTLPQMSLSIDGINYTQFDAFNLTDEKAIRINTKLQLIEGLKVDDITKEYYVTGNFYNSKKAAGIFPKIPKGEHQLSLQFYGNVEDITIKIEYQNLYI